MDEILMPGVRLNPLKVIELESGDVLHAMKETDDGYFAFGEAYFSIVKKDRIKAWKRHREMVLNLIVPIGEIQFVIYDDRIDSPNRGEHVSISLSLKNYQRLTVPPLVWMGFKGIGEGTNLLLNIASVSHDPQEVDCMDILDKRIAYNW